jgi:hypothetical protein
VDIRSDTGSRLHGGRPFAISDHDSGESGREIWRRGRQQYCERRDLRIS